MAGRYNTDYRIGQDNLRAFGMDIHNPVFWASAILVVVFVLGTLLAPVDAKVVFDGAKGWSIAHFDWLFMAAANVFVLFCLVLVVLPVGRIFPSGPGSRCCSPPAWASA